MPVFATSRTIAVRWAERALDLLMPPQCLSCGEAIDAHGALCASCWHGVRWIASPWCACCGLPFDFDPRGQAAHEALFCAGCAARRPEFDRARAVFVYDDASRRLVLGFKHADRTHGAPAFGRWLARAGAELLAEADIVAPVPLHWTRLAYRRYNQAALLARETARAAGRQVIADLLLRRRRTTSQGELGRIQRWRNVRGAFTVHPRHTAAISGARVLLVDDVLTTGATVRACARALRQAGALGVDVLTLARIVRPEVA